MEVTLINKYKELLRDRPKFGQGIENGLKIVSQLVAMNWNLSEGLDTLSHLLGLFNDKVYLDVVFGDEKLSYKHQLQRTMNYVISVLDYSEVFLELMVKSYLKAKTQWAIISIIVLLKTSMRLALLMQKRVMQRLYPMAHNAVARHQLIDLVSAKDKFARIYVCEHEMFFILKRSGRKLRKLEHTPPRSERSWNADQNQQISPQASQVQKKSLLRTNGNRLEAYHLYAEILFILKQAFSLGLVYFLGNGKLSFVLQLSIDAAALAPFLLTDRVWTEDERLEINRRINRMLIYLIKAPFEILFVLLKLLESSPLLGKLSLLIVDTLQSYNKIFFYMH